MKKKFQKVLRRGEAKTPVVAGPVNKVAIPNAAPTGSDTTNETIVTPSRSPPSLSTSIPVGPDSTNKVVVARVWSPPVVHPVAIPSKTRWERAYDELRADEGSKRLVTKYESILSHELRRKDPNTSFMAALKSDTSYKQLSTLADEKLKEAEKAVSSRIQETTDKFVKFVLFFKDFIDSAVRPDPHATLAWAGVCIFLPLILNPTLQQEALIDGVVHISDLCARYHVIECVYDKQTTSSSKIDLTDVDRRFDVAIVKLYTCILNYQVRIVSQMSESKASQTLQNIVKHHDWKELLTGIKDADAGCQDYIKTLHSAKLHAGFDDQSRQLDRMLQNFKKLTDRLDEKRKNRCIQTFRTSDYEMHKRRVPKRADNTCNWFSEHPSYVQWRDSHIDDILWVSAYPGCGKSVLSRYLVDQVFACPGMNVCYFFFKEDVEEQKHASNALCALIHQLLIAQSDLIDHAFAATERNGAKLNTLYPVLWSILESIITDSRAGNVIFVIDALDECALEGQERKKILLLESIMDFFDSRRQPEKRSTTIKFLLTSRPYKHIEDHFRDNRRRYIRLAGENETATISKEINIAVKARVNRMVKLSPKTRTRLETKLLETENRTYLWLTLVMAEVEEAASTNERKLLKLIENIPVSVDAAYDSILKKASNKQDEILRLLHIIVASVRPLTLQEMDIALAAQRNVTAYEDLNLEEDNIGAYIGHLCGLFVTVVDSRIYLIHQTAKHFLLKKHGTAIPQSWKHSLDLQTSHQILADICAVYLCLDIFDDKSDDSDTLQRAEDLKAVARSFHDVNVEMSAARRALREKHPFLDYSSKHWAYHFRQTKRLSQQPSDLESFVKLCDVNSFRFSIWFIVHREDYKNTFDQLKYSSRGFDVFTDLMVAAALDLDTVARAIATKSGDLDANDEAACIALQYAALSGSEAAVRCLLDNGASIDAKNMYAETTLYHAVKEGQERIVKLLLESGADVNAKSRVEKTALHIAAGEGNERILIQLLEHGADTNALNYSGLTALHVAAKNREKTTVLLLLQHIPIDKKDRRGRTALHHAAATTDTEVVEALLENGASLEARDPELRTPLHAVVERFSYWIDEGKVKSTIELLIRRGADIEAVDRDGNTAYSLAVEECCSRGVIYLLRPHGKSGVEVERDIGQRIIELDARLEADSTPTWKHSQLRYLRKRLQPE